MGTLRAGLCAVAERLLARPGVFFAEQNGQRTRKPARQPVRGKRRAGYAKRVIRIEIGQRCEGGIGRHGALHFCLRLEEQHAVHKTAACGMSEEVVALGAEAEAQFEILEEGIHRAEQPLAFRAGPPARLPDAARVVIVLCGKARARRAQRDHHKAKAVRERKPGSVKALRIPARAGNHNQYGSAGRSAARHIPGDIQRGAVPTLEGVAPRRTGGVRRGRAEQQKQQGGARPQNFTRTSK